MGVGVEAKAHPRVQLVQLLPAAGGERRLGASAQLEERLGRVVAQTAGELAVAARVAVLHTYHADLQASYRVCLEIQSPQVYRSTGLKQKESYCTLELCIWRNWRELNLELKWEVRS